MKNRYLGPCWEMFQRADGTIALTKLYVYLDGGGERRYALTEAEALVSCEVSR